jgi:hypothetical protein
MPTEMAAPDDGVGGRWNPTGMTGSERSPIRWDEVLAGAIVTQSDARPYWPGREERCLTPWVSEHLDTVGDLLGLNLQFAAFEWPVGAFNADIKAYDDSGRTVLIEVQFGPSDHGHLGKIVTYAAYAAQIVVWIAVGTGPDIGKPVRDEHRQTLRYLNEAFLGRTAFCAIGVNLESDPGQFDVVPRWQLTVRPTEYPSRCGSGVAEADQ